MDYNELKQISESKKIELKEIANELEMTPNGFRESIKNETIQLKKLKRLCEVLNISPILFFEVNGTGINITAGKLQAENLQAGNGNNMVLDSKEREIELLRERLQDKDEMINFLKEQVEFLKNK